MATEIDLKTLERKAYLSYHNDGLLDISLSLIISVFGIGMVSDMAWMAGVFVAVGVSIYLAVKKAITVPRLGLVHFGPERTIRLKKEISFFVIFFSFTALLGLVFFAMFTDILAPGGPSVIPVWLANGLKKFVMAPLGVIGAVAMAALAYWKQINRYYVYGAFLLVAVFAGPLLGISHHVYVTAVGALILISGLAVLVRFLAKYPLPVKEG